MGVDELLDVYGAVREAVGAEAFVGINPLGGDPVEVVRDAIGRGFASLFDGLWTDNAGIDESAEKIEALADASPGLPLAIASGITPENVSEIAQWADAVLVATGISHDFEHLDPERVKALARAASALLPKEAVGSPEVSEGADQA